MPFEVQAISHVLYESKAAFSIFFAWGSMKKVRGLFHKVNPTHILRQRTFSNFSCHRISNYSLMGYLIFHTRAAHIFKVRVYMLTRKI